MEVKKMGDEQARPVVIQKRLLNWCPDRFSRWISFRTICHKEQPEWPSTISSPSEGCSPEKSETRPANVEIGSSLLLMTWWDGVTAIIQGALFDLNAYCHEPLAGEVLYDETIAHQNAFITSFGLTYVGLEQLGMPLDILARSSTVARFASPLSDIVLHYPSSFSFMVDIVSATHEFAVKVNSLQTEVLLFAERTLEEVMSGRPCASSEWISAVGLASTNSTLVHSSEDPNASLIISALLQNGRGEGLLEWVRNTSNDAARRKLAKHLWKEVEAARTKLDELALPEFLTDANDLPRAVFVAMQTNTCLIEIAGRLLDNIPLEEPVQAAVVQTASSCRRRTKSCVARSKDLPLSRSRDSQSVRPTRRLTRSSSAPSSAMDLPLSRSRDSQSVRPTRRLTRSSSAPSSAMSVMRLLPILEMESDETRSPSEANEHTKHPPPVKKGASRSTKKAASIKSPLPKNRLSASAVPPSSESSTSNLQTRRGRSSRAASNTIVAGKPPVLKEEGRVRVAKKATAEILTERETGNCPYSLRMTAARMKKLADQ